MKRPRATRRRSGQAVVFLVMVLVVLLFAALWSADIHRIIFVKNRSQNAGDAAALAAARWQASSLNLLGELNLMHALALAVGNAAAVDLITNTQVRLCFVGPMTGMAAAQQAAKLNGVPVNAAYTEFVREHAGLVRTAYREIVGGQMLFPEPWTDAWNEYAAMLEALAADGVAAGADNAVFFTDRLGGHTLMDREFYEAIAGRNWCWFFLSAPGLLEEYSGYTWWPGLPPIEFQNFGNSEFFSLAVEGTQSALTSLTTPARLTTAFEAAGMTPVADAGEAWARVDQWWYAYAGGRWGRWAAMDPPFPVTGPVRPEYDYQGADAVIRVETGMDRFTPGADGDGTQRDAITWTAAAKPFGYLDREGDRRVPNAYGFVLPAFRAVRLIPVDTASVPGGGSFDLEWRRHVMEHLDAYLAGGTAAGVASCWYCAQLVTWEMPAFRQEGVTWLSQYSYRCLIRPGGGGGRRGGGSRRAH